ncbi:MAG: histidine kinase [Herminiimonas sp.]|nr:histidine kinase [Herminiimonas sp.]
MKLNVPPTLQQVLARSITWLGLAFDRTAIWVTQLSWFKFLLFALLLIAAGAIMEDTLFSPDPEVVIVRNGDKNRHGNKAEDRARRNSEARVTIDKDGIRIFNSKNAPPAPSANATPPIVAPVPPVPPVPPATPVPGMPGVPTSPDVPVSTADTPKPGITVDRHGDVHIALPSEIDETVREAIVDAVDGAAEEKVKNYRKQSSTWFTNFVLLLVLGLFGTKALMGGKKRAEAQATVANASAEREALQRQVSEAKMQMMQAQVEPHFLFNTLASVEHLIETDPPRASAMQRRLIQYLRAVLPQIRETAVVTNLGREADMVQAYLELLKMRMEERLQIDFAVAEGLRSASFPPMMLQSLIENAIKHGLECKPDGGTLRVSAEVAHNKLRVTVADDGMGFGTVKSDGTGTGLQNIRERLKLLYGNAGHLTIAASQPAGVIATIEVPYQLAN